MALGLFASEVGYDYDGLLEEIAALGAGEVLLVVPLEQEEVESEGPAARLPGWVVQRAIEQARRRGLEVGLMPIVELRAALPGQWRGQLLPRGGADEWFHRYRALVLDLAALAAQGGAARLGVGSELPALEPYEASWRGLIAAARRVFPGRVFYAVNWDGLDRPGFWDAVDEVGVSGYFALARPGEPGPGGDALRRAWAGPFAQLRDLGRRTGRPVFFSEIGYPSQDTAAARPWDDRGDGALDLELQARLYRAFCAAFRVAGGAGPGDGPPPTGFYLWNWFGFGGASDRGFTPRGKPAAAVARGCLRG